MQTKQRTYEITPNGNICFPIGTILAVKNLYEELNLSFILGKHKSKGIDFNSLIKALLRNDPNIISRGYIVKIIIVGAEIIDNSQTEISKLYFYHS